MARPIYSRLTGRRRTFAGYSQLWLGANHLLLVKSTRFAEDYRRFALQDVQAIVVTALRQRTVIQIGCLIAAVAWTLGFLAVHSPFAKGAFAFTGLMTMAAVVVDIARGQRCRCYLQTAVTRELLAPVSRLRQARKVIAQVLPAIEQVQGAFTAEHVPGVESHREPGIAPAPLPEVSAGHIPEILFGLLLIDGALVFLNQRLPRLELSSLMFTTIITEVLLAAIALVRKGPRNARSLVYLLVILTLLGVGLDMTSMLRDLGASIAQVVESVRQGKPSMLSFTWTPSHGGFIFAVTWRFVAGIAGFSAIFFERRAEVSQ